MRTTLDLDKPVLNELKALQKKDKRSLGRIVSELLAEALSMRREVAGSEDTPFSWNVDRMKARVELVDKDAVYAILDEQSR